MNKKLKYGSFAVAFTVVVITLVILLNAVFTAFVRSNSLYADMTVDKIYTISDEADEIYSRLSGRDIKIIFFTDPDVMMAYEYQRYIYEYALKLEDRYDFITVESIDSIENPEAIKPYLTTSIPNIYTTDVVVTNGEASKVMSMKSFYVFDDESSTEPWAFYGEYRFATTLMQLSYKDLLACFTNNHGESTESSEMRKLFEEAGFEVRDIDLAKEEIPAGTMVLIINDPVYDFAGDIDFEAEGTQTVNEIDKIDKYLDGKGNLMVFSDAATASNLPNLNEYLEEWGISFVAAQIEDKDNCIDIAGQAVVAEYASEGVASSLNEKIRDMENPPATIVENAMPIEILKDQHNSINVSPILTTHDTAKAYSLEDGKTVVKEGRMNLMTLSVFSFIGDNNERYQNYVLAAGTDAFTESKYLNSNSYGNSDIIYSLMRAFGKEFGKDIANVDIDFKIFDDQSLNVTLKEANVWTVVLTALLPSVALVSGVVVWIRRRHR